MSREKKRNKKNWPKKGKEIKLIIANLVISPKKVFKTNKTKIYCNEKSLNFLFKKINFSLIFLVKGKGFMRMKLFLVVISHTHNFDGGSGKILFLKKLSFLNASAIVFFLHSLKKSPWASQIVKYKLLNSFCSSM